MHFKAAGLQFRATMSADKTAGSGDEDAFHAAKSAYARSLSEMAVGNNGQGLTVGVVDGRGQEQHRGDNPAEMGDFHLGCLGDSI